MSEAATSINPNVPVGAETTTSSKANSMVTFDDVSDSQDAAKAATKPRVVKDSEEPKTDTKGKGQAKEEKASFDETEDDKPTPKAKSEKTDGQKNQKADVSKDQPAKAKVLKFKAGDQTVDLSSDALATVIIDGKKTEVPVQELLNNYSGKVTYEKKFGELHKERTQFSKEKESLNGLVKNLYEKATKEPEAAWDFLAEMTKQDPAKLKMGILRQQFDEMKELYAMDPEERERWFKEQELNFRDKAHSNREKNEQERAAQAETEAKQTEARTKYSIEEDEWIGATKLVHDFLGKQDPKFDGKVTPDQVVWASRHLMALEVVGQVVPHLESHAQFDTIISDIVHDLVRHPGMNREKLGTLLAETFAGEDKKGLKELARKAQKSAQLDDDDRPASRSTKNEALSFDDID
jgi:hypothetical protein